MPVQRAHELPAVAVPSGLSENGLPLSLQLLGRPFEEALLLRVAGAFEAATRFALPLLPATDGRGRELP